MEANDMLDYLTYTAVGAVIFVNGWTDAPNAVASAVGSRSMKPGSAVALAAVCNLAGAMTVSLTGGRVARSVYSIAEFGGGESGLRPLFAGLLAVVLWAALAWYFGIPTSESHALLAGISGAAAAAGGGAGVSGDEWLKVAVGILVSTLPAYFLSGAVFALTALFLRTAQRREVMPFFVFAQRAGAGAGAYLHGLQDGQKFMGIIMLVGVLRGGGWDGVFIPPGVALYSALLMALGTAMGGSRIIKRVALDMVSLDAPRGFAADVASSLCLAFATAAGLPVSTTHAKTCAVMGAGSALRRGGLDLRSVRDMVSAWALTFPACFLLGYAAAVIA